MPPRIRRLFLTFSLVLFLLTVAPLARELSQRGDIWWTPKALLVPLPESKDRVEIYARGRPLATLLQAGQLRIAEDGGVSALTAIDVGLRFNNWDRVRAERIPLLLAYAAVAGVTACIFLLVLTGHLAYHGEKEQ